MVRRRILEDPSVTNDVLFAAATEMEPDLEGLSMRQFNARYPLRVRRWELSERTRILHPTGPLSKAAAENPAAPVPPRPHLSLVGTDDADGSTTSQPEDGAPPSETESAAPRSDSPVAGASPVDAPPLEARGGPAASTMSQSSTSRLEAQPSTVEAPSESEPEASLPARAETPATAGRPARRQRARRQPANDARAEVMMVMLRWATAIGQAREIPEMFATLSTVDDYVDHIANVLDIP